MKESQKEKIKLRSAYLNGLALVFFGISGLSPFFAALNTYDLKSALTGVFLFFMGAISSWELHEMAQRNLSKLDTE